MGIFKALKDQLFSKWLVCKLISDKESMQYGIYFSYPIYLLIVLAGVFLQNPYILSIAALIALLGIKLPLHPLDYVYNYIVASLLGTKRIPGRGTELQVNSLIALVFNLIVIALIAFNASINYTVLGIIYAFISIYFIARLLIKD